MKTLVKKLGAVVLSACVLFLTATSAFASTTAGTFTYEAYDVITVTCDGQDLEIPVLRQVVQPRSVGGVTLEYIHRAV